MRNPTEVIFRPRISEKGTRLATAHNQYLFEVAPNATKLEIRQAITSLFGKKVIRVNTLRRKGCLLYTSPSPRDRTRSRMPSSA